MLTPHDIAVIEAWLRFGTVCFVLFGLGYLTTKGTWGFLFILIAGIFALIAVTKILWFGFLALPLFYFLCKELDNPENIKYRK